MFKAASIAILAIPVPTGPVETDSFLCLVRFGVALHIWVFPFKLLGRLALELLHTSFLDKFLELVWRACPDILRAR
jgi:hypothetical protein